MFTCREVTEICASDKKLSKGGKIKFKMHLLICRACSSYVKQIEILKSALKKRSDRIVQEEEEHIRKIEEMTIQKLKKGGEK